MVLKCKILLASKQRCLDICENPCVTSRTSEVKVYATVMDTYEASHKDCSNEMLIEVLVGKIKYCGGNIENNVTQNKMFKSKKNVPNTAKNSVIWPCLALALESGPCQCFLIQPSLG